MGNPDYVGFTGTKTFNKTFNDFFNNRAITVLVVG